MEEVVYFELNNWFPELYYPNEEPFLTWMGRDYDFLFDDEAFVRKNRLCIVESVIDQSINFCVTAEKKWVEENCPKLLTDYQQFLRQPDSDGKVYGNFGDEFLEFKESNIGTHYEGSEDDHVYGAGGN